MAKESVWYLLPVSGTVTTYTAATGGKSRDSSITWPPGVDETMLQHNILSFTGGNVFAIVTAEKSVHALFKAAFVPSSNSPDFKWVKETVNAYADNNPTVVETPFHRVYLRRA